MSLTTEDRQWILDALEQNRDRIKGEVKQAVKQEVSAAFEHLEVRFNQKLKVLETNFNEKLERLEINFNEKLEALETKLLTAFHSWASPMILRVDSHSAALRALDTRT